MYLSQLQLNRRRRGAIRLLGDRYAMHAAVASSIPPDEQDAGEGRILWRVDEDGDAAVLLTVTPTEPCLEHIVEQAGYTGRTWASTSYDRFLDGVQAGAVCRFRLTANPTRSVREPGAAASTRHGLTDYDDQIDWLTRKGQLHGFAALVDSDGVPQVQISRSRTEKLRGRGGRAITIHTARYDGLLTVTDPQALRTALTGGIGRARGFGCGLLTIAPTNP